MIITLQGVSNNKMIWSFYPTAQGDTPCPGWVPTEDTYFPRSKPVVKMFGVKARYIVSISWTYHPGKFWCDVACRFWIPLRWYPDLAASNSIVQSPGRHGRYRYL